MRVRSSPASSGAGRRATRLCAFRVAGSLLNQRLKPNSPARWAPAVDRGADRDLARVVEGAALPVREVGFPVAGAEELALRVAVAAVRAAPGVQGPMLHARRYVGNR